MSETLKKPRPEASTTPTVVVRLTRSGEKKVVVTPEMKAQLRKRAKTSTRSAFPELPEWRLEH
ncbi:hypothetical protein C5615_37965 [Burkholderia cepacia]|uniref:Uncharacterized protein n=1 Tax=Burkholderia cepacia TaxID=292 RepID=A0A2S8HXV1_BURCE|nr:hypothetical protein [Burkholderia cepacia]PQP07258.1 hypothetical protein C5615_37965 [Burkholderia cepacia]HDR9512128.1 hypothetical protein [Burkholderia cepacia]